MTLGPKDEIKSSHGLKDQPSHSKLKEVKSIEATNIKIQTMKSNGFNNESNKHIATSLVSTMPLLGPNGMQQSGHGSYYHMS